MGAQYIPARSKVKTWRAVALGLVGGSASLAEGGHSRPAGPGELKSGRTMPAYFTR